MSRQRSSLPRDLRLWADHVLESEGFDPRSIRFEHFDKAVTSGMALGLARPLSSSKQSNTLTYAVIHTRGPVSEDQRPFLAKTLLHEVSHVASLQQDHHRLPFYERLFRLAVEHGSEFDVTPHLIFERERWYKRNAVKVAARYGVVDAQQDLLDRSNRRCSWEGIPEHHQQELEQMSRGVSSELHDYLSPVEGVPHRTVISYGTKHRYEADRYEQCRKCGWAGYVFRPRLDERLWDTNTGFRGRG